MSDKKTKELAEKVTELEQRVKELENWRENILQVCDTYAVKKPSCKQDLDH